jgi:flagellar basal-body rod protein FlgB
MPNSDMPIFSMLRTKMHWHQERQRLLAENVSNASPGDLVPLNFDQSRALAQSW